MKLTYWPLLILIALHACNPTGEKKQQNINPFDSISELILKDSLNADLYFKRSALLLKDKKIDNAIMDMQRAIAINGSNAQYYITLSDLFMAKNQSRQAKEALEKCVELDPGNTKALLKLAEIFYLVKLYDQAIASVNKSLEMDPENSLAYFLKGYCFKDKGDTSKAIANFQLAVDKNQEYYEACILLGVLHGARKDKLAVNYYNNALNLKPKSIEAYYNLGMYYQSVEEINKAIESYTTIITSIDSTYSDAYFNLGVIHMKLDLFKEARDYYHKAFLYNTKNIQAIYDRGYMSELLGDLPNAKRDYELSLQISPQYPLAIEGLKRILKNR